MMHTVQLLISGQVIPDFGDWCYENIGDWSMAVGNKSRLIIPLSTRNPAEIQITNSSWSHNRWIFQGLSDNFYSLAINIKDDVDIMAVKLRWM